MLICTSLYAIGAHIIPTIRVKRRRNASYDIAAAYTILICKIIPVQSSLSFDLIFNSLTVFVSRSYIKA